MIYLLDSNVIRDLMLEEPRTINRITSIGDPDRVTTCAVVRGEILFGLERMVHGQRWRDLRRRAESVFSRIGCEPVAPEVGDTYAALKAEQEKLGRTLDENDLWIAATSRFLGAVVVSRDTDFLRVAGLPVENWRE